jgi:outer membrane protein assembly factor BamA
MKTVALVLVMVASTAAHAQPPDPPEGATIGSAQVSGFDLERLSPGLQDQIGRLAGGPLSREQLRKLAARIEEEQPRYVAAVRVARAPDHEVRVVFVVAHMRDQDRRSNVNARYLVERVAIQGLAETELSDEVRGRLQAVVGKPLGSDDVEQLEERLKVELSNYRVRRRITRGGRAGEIQLTFLVDKSEAARWLHFEPLGSKVVYHSDQGWGALLGLPISGRDLRVTPIIAIDNSDDLIEEYSGFGIRFESRKLGTERLGASLEWSRFEQHWRDVTLAALAANPDIPGAYDDRSTVTPLVTFAVTPRLRLSGGVSITEIEPLSGGPDSQMANAAVASIGYLHQWEPDARHDLAAAFILRAASATLESDFDYTRYFGRADYRYRWERHTVLVSGVAGRIAGDAPLFERFALGDSQTLRGWNKYDIAPAGANRMFHTSLEYRYRPLAFFLDAGSVWEAGTDPRVRVATGLGIHAGPFFMTVGFPLNTDEVRAMFTTGIRFGGIGVRKY